MGSSLRLAATGLIGAVALGISGVAVAHAETSTCRVRNVTQDTAGRSFARLVGAAQDGDRLTVRGTCLARRVRIHVDITIRGVGDRPAVLDAKGVGKVLFIGHDSVLVLRHLAITGGVARGESYHGGGFFNHGTLTLVDSVVRGNRAIGKAGGGIANWGTITLVRSVVRSNSAHQGGGLINVGAMTLVDSLVRGNAAGDLGGGIWNGNGSGTLTLDGSRVAGNAAGLRGGGIWSNGRVTLLGTAVIGNAAGRRGGGIWSRQDAAQGPVGVVTLDSTSSVTENTPDDCVGTDAC